jgi:hypothetical protein
MRRRPGVEPQRRGVICSASDMPESPAAQGMPGMAVLQIVAQDNVLFLSRAVKVPFLL